MQGTHGSCYMNNDDWINKWMNLNKQKSELNKWQH